MSLRRFTHRQQKDADLKQEIESHLAHEQDANLARGLSPDEARRQARLKFGNTLSRQMLQPKRLIGIPMSAIRLSGLLMRSGFSAGAIMSITALVWPATFLYTCSRACILSPARRARKKFTPPAGRKTVLP